MTDLKALVGLTALIALVLLAALVNMHNRHYDRRRLVLLEGEVDTIKRLLIEDRTI